MRMIKINIKILNIQAYFKSCFKFKNLNNFTIFFTVLVISLSVVLTSFPFIFLTIKVYIHTVRPHAHAFYVIRLLQVFLQRALPNICRKFTGEHPCQSVVSIMLSNFINITLWHGCSLASLLHVFRTAF